MKISGQFTMGGIKFFSSWIFGWLKNDWIREAVNDWDNHFLKTYAEIKPGLNFESVYKNIRGVSFRIFKKHKNFRKLLPVTRKVSFPMRIGIASR